MKKLIIIAVAGVLLVVCYFVFTKKTSMYIAPDLERSMVNMLLKNWTDFQSRFAVKAGESGTYNQPNKIQFIAPETVLVHYDDGLNDAISILRFYKSAFLEIKQLGSIDTLPEEKWKAIVKAYGDPNYIIQNFEEGIASSMIKVSENIFVR
jgi:hypothetical protein